MWEDGDWLEDMASLVFAAILIMVFTVAGGLLYWMLS